MRKNRDDFKYRVWRKEGHYLKLKSVGELSSGIVDINGDLIYENDFIQGDLDEFPYLVTFEDGDFIAVEQDGTTDVIESLSEIAEDCYVVGNIHENPELLEAEK